MIYHPLPQTVADNKSIIGRHADVQKHPILAGIESLQIHKYLGSQWVFGSGKDADDVDASAAVAMLAELESSSNSTAQLVGNSTAAVLRRAMKAAATSAANVLTGR